MASFHDRLHSLTSFRNDTPVSRPERGFSLLEMMLVVCITMILAAIAFISLQPMLKEARIDSGYDTALMTLRNYRSRAITERKRYMVSFVAPQTISVYYCGVGAPVNPAPVLVQTLTLPNDIQYAIQPGTPSTATTVPDGFGNGSVPIDFGQGLGAGNLNYVMFMPDGSALDQTFGKPNNGVLYMSRAGDILSMRAITVFGTTGRIRGWRLRKPGSAPPQWSQQ